MYCGGRISDHIFHLITDGVTLSKRQGHRPCEMPMHYSGGNILKVNGGVGRDGFRVRSPKLYKDRVSVRAGVLVGDISPADETVTRGTRDSA